MEDAPHVLIPDGDEAAVDKHKSDRHHSRGSMQKSRTPWTWQLFSDALGEPTNNDVAIHGGITVLCLDDADHLERLTVPARNTIAACPIFSAGGKRAKIIPGLVKKAIAVLHVIPRLSLEAQR